MVVPLRTGFGSRLIQQTIQRQLNGAVRVSFEPEGLVCDFEIPLRRTRVRPRKQQSKLLQGLDTNWRSPTTRQVLLFHRRRLILEWRVF